MHCSVLFRWSLILTVSVVCDVAAAAARKLAADRVQDAGFFWSAVLGALAFAPSIVAFGHGIKPGPGHDATVGIRAVGVRAANAIVGGLSFGDPWIWRMVVGTGAASLTVLLPKPTG